MNAFLILYSLCFLALIQCCLILLRPKTLGAHTMVSLGGLIVAFVLSVMVFYSPMESALGSLLYSNKLFRLVSSAMLLVALVVNRSLSHTKEIPEQRKPECYLFLTMVCIWSFILWFSTGILTTYFSLLGLGITALFSVGLAFTNRQEGEALLKYWYQLIVAMIFILISLLAVAIVAGDYSFKGIATIFVGSIGFKQMGFFFILLLPYLLIGGIVPFHFNVIDRDHGSPWALQTLSGLMISGSVYGGVMKFGVELFDSSVARAYPMRFLVCLGFIGTFWGLLAGLTQNNSKRRLAFFSLAMLSFPLMILGAPSGVTVGAAVFRFSFSLLALAALYWVLGWYHERMGGNDGALLAGVGRYRLGAGLLLIVGAGYFVGVPPIAGFSTTLALFGAAFHEKSLLVLLGIIIVSALAGLIMFRLLELAFFRKPAGSLPAIENKYLLSGILDHFIGAVLLLALIIGGVSWGGIWGRVVDAASALIQLY